MLYILFFLFSMSASLHCKGLENEESIISGNVKRQYRVKEYGKVKSDDGKRHY